MPRVEVSARTANPNKPAASTNFANRVHLAGSEPRPRRKEFGLGVGKDAHAVPDILWVFLTTLATLTAGTGVALWCYGSAVFHRRPYQRFPMQVFPFSLAYDATDVASKAARESLTLMGQGDAPGALRAADIALSHDGLLVYGHLRRSEALKALGRDLEALDSVKEAVKSGPHVMWAWLWMARLLIDQRRPQEALNAVDKALEMEPTWFEALQLRCSLLEELGQDVELLETINRILRSTVPIVGLWLRGRFLSKRGDRRGLDDLGLACKMLGQIRPNRARAAVLVDRAKALLYFHETGARADAERALLLDPYSAETRLAVVLCNRMDDKFDAAIQGLDSLLQDGTLPVAVRSTYLSNRAAAFLGLGQVETAHADIIEALSASSPTAFALSLAAEVALLQGRHTEALEGVLSIQQQSPRHLRAAEIAARVYEAVGDHDNAVQQYANFIRYADDWRTELEPHLPERIEYARHRLLAATPS